MLIKCTSCSLPLGEAAHEVENIVCFFCIDERNYFRGIFSGDTDNLQLGSEYDSYWSRYQRFKTWREMPHNYNEERATQWRELQAYMCRLKYNCDKEQE